MAARRAYGSGSITRKGKGWLVRARLGYDPVTGVEVRLNRVVHGTKGDAQRVLDEFNSRRLVGRNVSTDVPVRQLIVMWRSIANHATGTARNYDNAFALLPDHILDMPAHRVSPLMLDELYSSLRRAGEAVDTIRYLHAGLGATFTQAVTKWRIMASNPASAATPPPKPQRHKNPLTRDMPAQITAAAATFPAQVQAWVAVHLATGARRSEVLALQWEDINFTAGHVEIVTALDPTADAVTLKSTKGRDRRVLPLGPGALKRLAAWRAECDLRDGELGPASWVFTLNGVDPWRPDYATKKWSEVRARAGLRIKLHDCRDLVGTLASDEAGANDKAVAGFLGHAQITTTHGYLRAMPDRALDIARVLDALSYPSSPGRGRSSDPTL